MADANGIAGHRAEEPMQFLAVAVWFQPGPTGDLCQAWHWTREHSDALAWIAEELKTWSQGSMGYVLTVQSGGVIGSTLWPNPWHAGETSFRQAGMHPMESEARSGAGLDVIPKHVIDQASEEGTTQQVLEDWRLNQLQVNVHAASVLHNQLIGQRPRSPHSTNGEPVIIGRMFRQLEPQPAMKDLEWTNAQQLQRMTFNTVEGHRLVRGVRIAVLSTGFDPSASTKLNRVPLAIDATGLNIQGEDRNGAGTALISLLSGTGLMTATRGVAEPADVVSVKVITDQGWGSDSMIARGVRAAERLDCDAIVIDGTSLDDLPYTQDAIQSARAKGIAVVVPAWPLAGPGSAVACPGDYPGVIAAHAMRTDGTPTAGQSQSQGIGVHACGVDVYANGLGGKGAAWYGNSAAAAFVAGAIARCLATVPNEIDLQFARNIAQEAVQEGLDRFPTDKAQDPPGWFALNAGKALERIPDLLGHLASVDAPLAELLDAYEFTPKEVKKIIDLFKSIEAGNTVTVKRY